MESRERLERIEKLLLTKAFTELDDQERTLVLSELASEEEYELIRKMNGAFAREREMVAPAPETLKRLRAHMRSRVAKQFSPQDLLHLKVPAYAVFLLCVVFAFLLWERKGGEVRNQVAPVTQVSRDTIYVQSKADTVLVERVIIKYRSAPPARSDQFNLTNRMLDNVSGEEDGVSMKDKEELDDLLVSGS